MRRGILVIAAALLGMTAAAGAEPAVSPAEWASFRDAFVEPSGRVVDDANAHISHSEGQGYGMLLAVLADQQADFDAMWSFTRSEMMIRDDGLIAWKWDPAASPHITDVNNASDGDILVAHALDLAAKAWGREDFTTAAHELAIALGETVVLNHEGRPLLLPGAVGFDAEAQPDGPVVNLSYWVFEAIPTLARLDPLTDWTAIGAEGLRLLELAQFGPRRLPPDWLSLAGEPKPAEGFPAEFGYNALRIPLYLIRGGVDAPDLLARLEAGVDANGDLTIGDLATGGAQTRLTDPGYRTIVGLMKCSLDGTALPPDLTAFRPTTYYASTLHLLALAHAREAMPQCM